MVELSLSGIIGWIGLICLWLALYLGYRETKQLKKEGKYKYVEETSWLKQTYLWQVFFTRTFYRPVASSFPYVIFIIPAMMMVLGNLTILINIPVNGNPLLLEEMNSVTGVVTKAHRGKGKGSFDYIKLKEGNGNENIYRLSGFYYDEEVDEFTKKFIDTKKEVTIWYQDWRGIESYKKLRELRVDNKLITLTDRIHFKYNYESRLERYEMALPNLIWWLGYSSFGWLWLWFLNKKELPIHVKNKQKHYEKNRLKDR